jgi:hypothetical protein
MTTTSSTATTATTTDTASPDVRIAEVLSAIDTLLARQVALAEQVAAVRERLADLAEARRLREAMAQLAVEGKNETERQARLRLQLAADADYRAGLDGERQTRLELARREAELWATRMKMHACLALLRLAGGDAGADAGGAEARDSEDREDTP